MGHKFQVIEPFAYPEALWTGAMAGISERLTEIFPASNASIGTPGYSEGTSLADCDDLQDSTEDSELEVAERIAFERRSAEERGYHEGFEAAQLIAREAESSAIETERAKIRIQAISMIESLDESRAAYFQAVEQETVRLAVAIASRILRREAQMDPLLLTGAVRVALSQLCDTTDVRLLVPAQDEDMWNETMKRIPRLSPRPKVIADSGLALGECRIETELGSVDLGLEAQLKEIERSFLEGPGNTERARGKVDTEEIERPEAGAFLDTEEAPVRPEAYRDGHLAEASR